MTDTLKIPKIFHFIKPDTSHFTLVHYLSIMSAYNLNSPDKIYVYCKGKQYNDIFWGILNDIVEYEFIEDTDNFNPDVIIMQKLIERGGVYIDINTVSLKPITIFLNNNIVCSEGSRCNILMTEPYNSIIVKWLKKISDNIKHKTDYNKLNILKDVICNDDSKNIKCESNLSTLYNFKDTDYTELLRYYTINFGNDGKKLTMRYLNTHSNAITILLGNYIKVIYDNIKELEIFIERCYSYGWHELLSRYSEMHIELSKRFGRELDIMYPYYKLLSTHELNDITGNHEIYDFIVASYTNISEDYPIDPFKL